MGVFPEIVEFYDVPNQTEWVKIVLEFDPETKEYKIYKDKKLEHQTTDKKFVAKLTMTDPIKKVKRIIEVKKEAGFECEIKFVALPHSRFDINNWILYEQECVADSTSQVALIYKVKLSKIRVLNKYLSV